MYFSEKELLSSREIIGFTIPTLHKGKQWYVDFYAHDPATGQKKNSMASMIIHNLLAKLAAGWNPWTNADKGRQFTPIQTIISRYRDYIQSSTKKKSMKEKTAKDYLSRMNMLETFIGECAEIKYAYQLDRAFCIDFLDHPMSGDRHFLAIGRIEPFVVPTTMTKWKASRFP